MASDVLDGVSSTVNVGESATDAVHDAVDVGETAADVVDDTVGAVADAGKAVAAGRPDLAAAIVSSKLIPLYFDQTIYQMWH